MWETAMLQNSAYEQATRVFDGARSCTLFERIETALAEARACDDTVCEALKRVRGIMHNEFRDVTVVRSFCIEEALNFNEWHVVVRYADGREVALTHES